MAENQEPLIECPDCGCRFDSPAVARLLAEQAEQAEAERDRLREAVVSDRDDALDIKREVAALRPEIEDLIEEKDALRRRVAELEGAVRWALGYEDGVKPPLFRPRKEGEGAYWWRRELRERVGWKITPRALAGQGGGEGGSGG